MYRKKFSAQLHTTEATAKLRSKHTKHHFTLKANSEIRSCRPTNSFDTVGWAAGRAYGL